MAIMYPKDIESMKYTESEKVFYNTLENQLSDDYHVFFSISWLDEVDGVRENSECDFLIFNSQYGFITIEVKGGHGIEYKNGNWKLIYDYDDNNNINDYRKLKKSPFQQSRKSMYYFKNYYQEQYNENYRGVYGYAVAFPFYSVEAKDLNSEAVDNIIIDYNDLDNIETKLNQIYHYWKGYRNRFTYLSSSEKKQFIKLVNKRIALSAAAGALIDHKQKQLKEINRIQDAFISFIKNYNQAFITGGAGTGKTWIAMKKARNLIEKNNQVLFLCYNSKLANFIDMKLRDTKIKVLTINKLLYNILGNKNYNKMMNDKNFDVISHIDFDVITNYDSIIIDEGQDFKEDWAFIVKGLLEDNKNSELYVFYDFDQNIFGNDFGEEFMIDNPPFILNENLRNTSNIFNWTAKKTGYGQNQKPNILEGAEPEVSSFNKNNQARRFLNQLLNQLILNEKVSNKSLVILSNRLKENSILSNKTEIGSFKIKEKLPWELNNENEISYITLQSFKGLESDVVIYLNHSEESYNLDYDIKKYEYVAYTRARFYLYVLNINN
ncbi:NERD domain-containing protein/DEAD/DEAH box helicase [Halanaerobiaceae bacterium Z-7014]|uniref:NERD domain-containing protein/DEAD/DEAH box helicase n=1 Tax=Halonatronomonas betaini TaxID=2778430 RepID=A0A931ARZ0_9FIRM|nr:NERD domain-containing protein/DEAD/DEAH box helicase [Halonatronomonas betaini]MBF8435519.1 NERD domain-containing protein/DEAD/DEAH box helicase [Halonatronomonas betaini]